MLKVSDPNGAPAAAKVTRRMRMLPGWEGIITRVIAGVYEIGAR